MVSLRACFVLLTPDLQPTQSHSRATFYIVPTLGPGSHLTNSSNTTLLPSTGRSSALSPHSHATRPSHYTVSSCSSDPGSRDDMPPPLALCSGPPCGHHHLSPALKTHSSRPKALIPLIACSKSFRVSHYPPISQLPPMPLGLRPTFHSV